MAHTSKGIERNGVLIRIRRRDLRVGRVNIRVAIESEADRVRLAASIAKNGQAQPVTAVPIHECKYDVVAGGRRVQAVRDDVHLDVRVLPADTPESILWRLALAENHNRKDLKFIERTLAFAYAFDAVACDRFAAYRNLAAEGAARLRAHRNRVLNAANSRRSSKDSGLEQQLYELFDELKATHPNRVEAKTFWPRHLCVLDLPAEILGDVAELKLSNIVRLTPP